MLQPALASLGVSMLGAPLASSNDLDRSFTVGPHGTLRMYLDRGRLNIQRHDALEVRIEASARGLSAGAGGFLAEQSGNDVTVEGNFGFGFFWVPWGPRVTVNAWVPANYSVAVETRGGSVEVDGVVGLVVAQTHGGRVDVRNIDGSVSVQTSGGAIDVAAVAGSVVAHTSGGRIAAADICGNIEVNTSGGSIELSNIDGRIEATTSGGAIRASFVDEPEGLLETSGGRIEVAFPTHSHVDLDAETSGGTVVVDHAIDTSERGSRRVVGRINGGGPTLRLRTSGGSIQVGASAKS